MAMEIVDDFLMFLSGNLKRMQIFQVLINNNNMHLGAYINPCCMWIDNLP